MCRGELNTISSHDVFWPATQWGGDCEFVCVGGFLPTLTCAVLCKTHEYVILLPLELYSFNLERKKERHFNKSVVYRLETSQTLSKRMRIQMQSQILFCNLKQYLCFYHMRISLMNCERFVVFFIFIGSVDGWRMCKSLKSKRDESKTKQLRCFTEIVWVRFVDKQTKKRDISWSFCSHRLRNLFNS